MANAYQTGHQKVIPAVLIYPYSKGASHSEEVLLIRKPERVKGEWNGLGGKLDPGESPEEAASRELFEEAGVQVSADRFQALGTLHFPNFVQARQEDWTVFVFAVDLKASERERVKASSEGELHWIDTAKLVRELKAGELTYNFWDGDLEFLPHVLARKPFQGTLWYEDGAVQKAQIKLF